MGLVTDAAVLRKRPKPPELAALLMSELRRAPELTDVVRHSELCDDVLPNRRARAHAPALVVIRGRPFGPNWVAVGDAAMFVDPIVPSGVGFAMLSGHRAAYTWLTQQSRPDVSSHDLWAAYAWYVRGEYGAMSQLARFLYANNAALPGPFWRRPALRSFQLDLPEHCTLSGCDFFPFPKAFGWRIVAPLLSAWPGKPVGSSACTPTTA